MTFENDDEMLDAFLDNALSPEELAGLAARLAREPQLASRVEVVREERALRAAAWQSMEPDQAASRRFAASLIRSMRRQRAFAIMHQVSRIAVAAAACILLGVGAGWYLWGRPPASSANLARTSGPSANMHLVADDPRAGGAGAYQVAITDGDGNVVAMQKFNRLDEASQFAQDVGRYEERRADVQDGKAMLVSDRF